jgi:hypothetical protein
MTDNFNYSLVKTDAGTYSVRSTIKSYNLDHVTDKDIVSFYRSFSQYASMDTGLLPLDGTGVLAIRSAGSHTQVVTQHSPGMYYINWGSHENDQNAKAYYVAQPYRVVIGDFQDGNLLGARMFYSPYPITSPSQTLYHVNLPNINCKGYRGNGVGWICLYLNEDWSSIPFNEKVSKFIERCSGVETFNDANMSETDGPRFYKSFDKPSYIYDPEDWQTKSQDGYLWTLDPDLWIPVLVKDMDNQDRHYDSGQPLTLAMAMLGDYQAYYTDTQIPKIYNIISRPDKELNNAHIAKFIRNSFLAAPATDAYSLLDNPYQFTVENREKNGKEVLDLPLFNSIDEWDCENCHSSIEDHDSNETADGSVCNECFNEYYVSIKSTSTYYNSQDDNIIYCENSEEYYHTEFDTTFICHTCPNSYGQSGKSQDSLNTVNSYIHMGENGDQICIHCFADLLKDNDLTHDNCASCAKPIVTSGQWVYQNPPISYLSSNIQNIEQFINSLINNEPHDYEYSPLKSHLCHTCAPVHYICPCGFLKPSSESLVACTPTTITSDEHNIQYSVNQCCNSCLGPVVVPEGSEFFESYYSPSEQITSLVINKKIYQNITGVDSSTIILQENNNEQSPF